MAEDILRKHQRGCWVTRSWCLSQGQMPNDSWATISKQVQVEPSESQYKVCLKDLFHLQLAKMPVAMRWLLSSLKFSSILTHILIKMTSTWIEILQYQLII